MKILILSRYQKTASRGVETVVTELVQRLEKNHQVTVLSGKNSDSFRKMISDEWDIVMPLNGRTQSLKASLGRLFKPYKLVIGGHSGIGRDDIWNIIIARPNVFIALTDYMKNWAQKWGKGITITKIPNGIDLKKFTPIGSKYLFDLPKPIILSVGALAWYKHHEKTIEAVSHLEKASLVIIGKGEEKDRLNKLGNQKLKNRFKILEIPYQDMPEIYRSADVFTLPSWNREAFGVVYLEALASNIPIVAPNDPPRKEIIGMAGVLTNVDNSEQYAKALEEALKTEWGTIPRKQAEKFSWEKIVEEYEKCFLKLLS